MNTKVIAIESFQNACINMALDCSVLNSMLKIILLWPEQRPRFAERLSIAAATTRKLAQTHNGLGRRLIQDDMGILQLDSTIAAHMVDNDRGEGEASHVNFKFDRVLPAI